jgi:hypothetical protein
MKRNRTSSTISTPVTLKQDHTTTEERPQLMRTLLAQGERSARRPLADEALVLDARAQVRPAQLVEQKLIALLKSRLVPVSQVRTTSLTNARSHC